MATDAIGRLEPTVTASLPIAKGAMALLGAMVFIVSLGYGAGLPLIRPYLLRYLGAVPASAVAWHVGMLGGVYLFALFLFAPLWGRLSDRHGRMLVLLIGFATFLVGSTATALAPSLGFVYAARFAGRRRCRRDRADSAGLHSRLQHDSRPQSPLRIAGQRVFPSASSPARHSAPGWPGQ